MHRVPLIGLLVFSTACATEGIYRPTRLDVGASVSTVNVEYQLVAHLDDNTTIVSTNQFISTTAGSAQFLVTTHLATIGEGGTHRWSRLPVDLGLEWPVTWLPRVTRPDIGAPTLRVWMFTPRFSLRFPARRPTQLFVGVGGGVAWYTDGYDDERRTTTGGVPSVTFGLRRLVTDAPAFVST
jgi:hypothetical protein